MQVALVDALHAVAGRSPAAPALTWRGSQSSFGDLRAAIAAARAVLVDRQLPHGSRIALLFKNSPHYVAWYYGVLAAGCVVVPLNAHERAAVLARQVEHCGASLLIGDTAHPEWANLNSALQQLSVAAIGIELHDGSDCLERFIRELNPRQIDIAAATPAAHELAAIIYTSGTTGRPKGVMLSHGNLSSNTAAIISYLKLSSADRGLCVLPFHFSYGNSVLHSHLLSGAHLAIEDNFAFPQVTLRHLQDEAITGFAGVPSTFALLLARCRIQDFDLRQLRYVTQAGGAMPASMTRRLREQLPGVQIFIMYGQTEATARLTYLPPSRLDDKPGSVGIALPGVQIEVRHQGLPVPPGVTGEIHVRGPNVMLGYWNDPAASAEVLQEGWLNTGDLGYRDEDGFLYIVGRAVEMIKVGAYRVAPQEIEEVVVALAGVEDVAATAIADEILGQAIKVVIVPTRDGQLDARTVKAHCRERLAAYKIPKVVEFATGLPRTSSGKVQRYKLA